MLLLTCHAGMISLQAQTHIFAQISGSPANTSGWNLQGQARVGNILFTDNSEIILCPATGTSSGALFFNQPINLSICNKWVAEFDFRMFDGSGADGIAFCFLDVPPTGFVSGGGMGIPGSANGLKVCFDQYPNCAGIQSEMPKIQIRWGVGYDECWSQPTLFNSGGNLNFIRSAVYNRARIVYNNGTIEVYVNNTLYLTGFQLFNFTGYMGFTSSTGGLTDNHSIRNVIIYTDMPPSDAGRDTTVCSGSNLQLGTTPNSQYVYSWTPVAGLSASNIANPTAGFTNTGSTPQSVKYYVQTGFNNNPACASTDSITVTVLPLPAATVQISSQPAFPLCPGTPVTFTASTQNAGANPVYEWRLNGLVTGDNSNVYTLMTPAEGDQVQCLITTSNTGCPGSFNSNLLTVSIDNTVASVAIQPLVPVTCAGGNILFTATPVNGGTDPAYSWLLNGQPAGASTDTFTLLSPSNGDRVQCILTSSLACVQPVSSNEAIVQVLPAVQATVDLTICEGQTAEGYSVPGVYTDTFISDAGCDSIRILNLFVRPRSFSSLTQTICEGDDYLGYTTSGVYRDTLVAANGCDSVRTLDLTVLPLSRSILTQTICEGTSFLGYSSSGTYRDTLVAANGCDSIRTLTLTVIPRIRTVVNRSICEGQSLEGYTVSGTYVDTLLSAAGCDSIRTLILTVQPRQFSTLSQTICSGESYLGYTLAGTYVDTLLSAVGCDSIRTLILTVKPLAASLLSQTICAGTAVEGYTQTGTYVDTFTAANGCDSIRTLRLTVLPLGRSFLRESICSGQQFLGYTETGTYVDTLVAANGCDSIRTLELNVITPVQPALGGDTTLCRGLSLTLTPGSYDTYRWSDGSTGSTLTVSDEGLYSVTVSGTCITASDDIRVQLSDCYTYFPSAFSPNGDGRNDRFRILTTFTLTRFQLTVYNRWGEPVFITGDPAAGWDGTYKGKAMPPGTYVYTCSYFRDGTRFREHKGTVVLVR